MAGKVKSQSTWESCLAWCLLYLAGEEPTKEKELMVIEYALRFTKKDFTIGHLEAVNALFKKITLHIDDASSYEWRSAAQLKKSKNIDIFPCDILNILDFYFTLSKVKQPVIIYLDAFALWKRYHYPHYVIVLSEHGKSYKILDPWNGKTRIVPKTLIRRGIIMLKEHLGFATRAITIVSEGGK